jgi:hypothetical protein
MSDARPNSPEKLARYLDRVRGAYRYGIPQAAIRAASPGVEEVVLAPPVSFIVVHASEALPSEHQALVDSIAIKGLKLALEQTARRVVTSDVELRTALEEHAGYKGVLIVLGAENPDGRLENVGEACVLYSHSLTAVATDPAVKRAFWGHLQTVLARLA